jgi:hypothetical protein
LWARERGEETFHALTGADEQALRARFVAAGRERFWEL